MGYPLPLPNPGRGHQHTITIDFAKVQQRDRFLASEYSFDNGLMNIWFRNEDGSIKSVDVVVLANVLSVNITPVDGR